MSKNHKTVCICGHFGGEKNLLNGQTVKTKIIACELENVLGQNEILKIDTHISKKQLFNLLLELVRALKICKNIIILPAQNGLRVIAPILVVCNIFFHRSLHYVVIGGWLPEFLASKRILSKVLKQFEHIYVETEMMKRTMLMQKFDNVSIMPNCKNLRILKENELVYQKTKPYMLCTFSRVMKEKGIEDAINAVKLINEKDGYALVSLDIYGQIEEEQKEWFAHLKNEFPSYVKYCGQVSFDSTTEILKNYHALIFPTFYEGEGFAGTIIDALAAGLPVIASDWKYNTELLSEGINGLIYQTKNLDNLVEKIIWSCSHVNEWNEMKRHCIEECEKYLPQNVISILLKKLQS